ncbi:hypothetical protein [Legionella oakridgensis]|nr:hypothetical protein [Legionella oakridgensis]
MGELQKDSSSCSIFCIDQAFHMSKIVDLHAQLAQVKKQDPKHKARLHVDPFDLPPVLVKNVQSVSFIGKYLTKHPEYEHLIINKKGQTLREYAASHYVTTADGTIAGAIQYKQQRYRTRVNKSKGYPEDPHYKEKLAAQAQNTIAQAIKKIDHLNVDFDPSQSLQEIHSALLLQLKKIRDSRPLKDAYTVLNLKKPPQALQEVIAKKQEQIDRLLFLSEMKFDKHLVIFIAKNDEMMEKAKKNPDYEKATQTTTVFCEALVAAMNKFLHARAEQPFKENLYDDCKMAIRNASKILHKHREWIGAIKKFLIDIAAFLTLGFSDGKLGIFAKTDSGQKLDAFEVDVVNQLNATG